MTISRLELLAMLIGVRAAHFMIKQLELEIRVATYGPTPVPTGPFTRCKTPFQALTAIRTKPCRRNMESQIFVPIHFKMAVNAPSTSKAQSNNRFPHTTTSRRLSP
ncbi:unnamed protein product [Onchocerca ochengi]|uniref:Secreted protein n=1 Tax=Onchocerca ochengi TaxID=42157 RepID=A0A182EP97_ONCOC|nr:unnamed protein product [Onchocerca ochengi]